MVTAEAQVKCRSWARGLLVTGAVARDVSCRSDFGLVFQVAGRAVRQESAYKSRNAADRGEHPTAG